MQPSPRPDLPPLRTQLIFNPVSGAPGSSPGQLLAILTEMQAWNMIPEVLLVDPNIDLAGPVRDALRRGIRMFVVSGGDGTVDTVAGVLIGTRATLGVIPTGTRNNVALSLRIPGDIPSAVALLRTGLRTKIDVGVAACGDIRRHFLEACSVGLLSALFPAADDIQHGNLARVGDLLSALVASPIAEIDLLLDRRHAVRAQAHIVLIGNMPYVGPNYQIAASLDAHTDGLLDVLVFAELSKLELIGNVVPFTGAGLDDPRIQRYLVRQLRVLTNPEMPVLVDGFTLGEGPLHVSIHPRSLAVIAGLPTPEPPAEAAA